MYTTSEADNGFASSLLGDPGRRYLVEPESLDVDRDPSGGDVFGNLEVRLPALVWGEGEVRMAEDGETLPTDDRGREGRLRPCGLAEVNDSRLGRGSLGGGPDRLTPQRVDHEGGSVAAACFPQPLGQIAVQERHGCIGPQLERPLEPIAVATRGDDPLRAQQPGGLEGDRPDGTGRAEDEHAISRLHRRSTGDGQPAGDARDSARGGDRFVEPVRQRNCERGKEVGALDEKAVSLSPTSFSEQVQALPVATSHGLASGHVGERWMAAVEAAGGDSEIDGVERDGDDLDRALTLHLH